jgi:histidinol-phosphatase (PHP family)
VSWFSFHGGHSGEFCRHARGTAEEILEAAVDRGFTSYGLSEHAPKSRASDLYEDERDLSVAESQRVFDDYTRRALDLRERFAERIEVLVGFETDVVPSDRWVAWMRALRARASFDYVVGSVHHVNDWPFDYSSDLYHRTAEACGGRDALDQRYFDQVAEVASALRPEIIGHIDLIRVFRGPSASFAAAVWPRIEGALEAVRAAGSLLDVNAAPARKQLGPVYPLPAILKRANEMEIPATLGDDSHGPDQVGVGLDACLRALADAGYRVVHCLRREGGAITAEPVGLEDVRPRR